MINRQIIDFEIKKTGIPTPATRSGGRFSYQLSVKFPTGLISLRGFRLVENFLNYVSGNPLRSLSSTQLNKINILSLT
jgi:hypothetical protein